MVRKFRLTATQEDGSMEHYIAMARLNPLEKREAEIFPMLGRDHRVSVRENAKILHQMKLKPSDFFNFGLLPEDYAFFLHKQIWMRVLREIYKARMFS